MNFLQRSWLLPTLRRPLIPIKHRRNIPHLNFKASECRCRTFTNTVVLRQKAPHPNIKNKNVGRNPPPPPPPLWPKEDIAAGVIIGSCVSIWAVLVYTIRELEATKRETAEKRLQNLQKHLTLSVHSVEEGRWYTLLTSSFTPLDYNILLVNMLGVWFLGRPIVRAWRIPTFAVLYLGSGVAGAFGQFLVWKKSSASKHDYLTWGSTNSVLGLLGAFACSNPTSIIFGVVPIQVWQASAAIITINLANLGLDLVPSMGSAGHLGGIAFGALYTIVVIRKGRGIPWRRK